MKIIRILKSLVLGIMSLVFLLLVIVYLTSIHPHVSGVEQETQQTQANKVVDSKQRRDEIAAGCGTYVEAAESVMKAYQNGKSAYDLLMILESTKAKSVEDGEFSEEADSMIKTLIHKASDYPRYNSESYKERVVTDFKDHAFKDCMAKDGNVY